MTTLITKDNLAANTITAEKISSSVALGGPKISSLDYPGDDTAALPAGGQTVTINGTGFVSGATVYLDGTVVSPVAFISTNSISFTTPAKSANSYVLYVINPDGATAIAIPGLTYSGVPTWTTSAGSLGAPYEANSFSVTLQATSDSNVTFSMSAGNTLPSGLSLAANGLLSGTIPATEANTTYTFYVDAIDAQNQETSRTFSITYTRDTVTWSSPANGAAYSLDIGVANTVSLSATSAAGKSITYTVQSGSLPANVSISGANVAGTPNTSQNNTSVVIRATAADTNRFTDRTLYFTVLAGGWNINAASLSQTTNQITSSTNFGTVLFSTDGFLTIYVESGSNIRTGSLSSSFDLSTVTGNIRNFTPPGTSTSGLYFNTDGTKMYVADYSTKLVYYYTLGTAWDTSTASLSSSYNVSTRQNFPFGVWLSPDGTKMYVSGNGNGQKGVQRFDLSTPWDVSSSTFVNSFIPGDVNNMAKVFLKPDGTRLYISYSDVSDNGYVKEYSLSTPWDLTTTTLTTTLTTYPPSSYGFYPGRTGLWFNSTGKILMLTSEGAFALKYNI